MTILIWVKNIAVLFISVFFLIVGINTIVGSYGLNNPYEFVVYFFSASLLILVCISGLIYFFVRVFHFKRKNEMNNNDGDNDDEAK